MFLKEKGYDEFLAQKIEKGLSELEAGKGISLEQAKMLVQVTIEETANDLADFEREVAYA